jgi:hypothetical protein
MMPPRVASFVRSGFRAISALLLLALSTVGSGRASGASVTLRPSKDTTLYSATDLANGAGAFLFAGTSGERRILRSPLAFDLGQIPAGATINSATLTLTINTPLARNSNTVRLHRLSADWGEGTSVAPSGGGGGAAATAGSATWNARFFGTSAWSTPGGDFSATASASQPVSGSSGTAVFSGTALVADIQGWVNNAAPNFGWILVAQDESGPAVRFASREGAGAPVLVVDFTPSTGGGNTAPVFTVQPGSQSVVAGATVTLTATATGTPAPVYQWHKNGVSIQGATSSTLTLPNVSAADSATYTVVATNVAGNATSLAATLTVNSPSAGTTARLSNLSVRAAMAANQTLIVGFSVSGGSRSLVVRGVGPTLASFGLTGTMSDPRLELYNGSALVAENDNWGNSAALTAAFTSVGAFPLVEGSRDAALLQPIDGTRSLHLKGTAAGVALVELYDTGAGNSPRLTNVSARNQVGTGDNILIFGFFIDGTGTKNVLIRAVGPKLAELGVTGVLLDPRFEVFLADRAAAVASNDNWDAGLASTFTAVGAFPLTTGSRDAALVTALAPGSYTVQVSGVAGGTGEALVEIYEVP